MRCNLEKVLQLGTSSSTEVLTNDVALSGDDVIGNIRLVIPVQTPIKFLFGTGRESELEWEGDRKGFVMTLLGT